MCFTASGFRRYFPGGMLQSKRNWTTRTITQPNAEHDVKNYRLIMISLFILILEISCSFLKSIQVIQPGKMTQVRLHLRVLPSAAQQSWFTLNHNRHQPNSFRRSGIWKCWTQELAIWSNRRTWMHSASGTVKSQKPWSRKNEGPC